MQGLLLSLSLAASAAVGALAEDVKIDVTYPVECDRRTKSGDAIEVHYRGTLASNGNKFDASYDRGSPFGFTLGQGRVIKGWEDGLLDMCIGEKRTLTVPPESGYGKRSMGPIPADSTLVFETELMGIKGVPKPESIVAKATDSASSATDKATDSASSAAGEASTAVAGKIVDAVEGAAEFMETVLGDTDSGGPEHNEL